ncbi:GGDEF domain-containing protein [bacterium]|nr:GGDEF domain-containing protein [bacterium]
MKKRHLLEVITLTIDFDLNIVFSKFSELKGRNLIDLCMMKGRDLRRRLRHMKKNTVYQEEVFMLLDKKPKRYSLVARRGTFKYICVLIELEMVYELMDDVSLYRKYAFTDNLTGALTRHGYWNALFEMLRYAESYEYNIGILFIDVDNLKMMNTTLGYNGGDLQIREVSHSIKVALRKRDLLVRLGGDEFLAILPIRDNSSEILNAVAQRVLRNVRNNKKLKTTVSIGVDHLETKEIAKVLASRDVKKAWEKYIEKADVKVRLAKKTGKNQAI